MDETEDSRGLSGGSAPGVGRDGEALRRRKGGIVNVGSRAAGRKFYRRSRGDRNLPLYARIREPRRGGYDSRGVVRVPDFVLVMPLGVMLVRVNRAVVVLVNMG